MITLVTGGARSGKSCFAEKLADSMGKKVLYIATAEAFDEEMKRRIEIHQERRSSNWKTYEGYLDLGRIIEGADGYDCILLDCLTILITNLMFVFGGTNIDSMDFEKVEQEIFKEMADILECSKKKTTNIILVSNEIGLGLVPETKFGRVFRDIAGKINQMAAKDAQQVYFVISGIPMKIKGELL